MGQPAVTRDLVAAGIKLLEVACWIAFDPVIAHGHPEHAAHVAERVVGDCPCTAGDDAGEDSVHVHGLYVRRRDGSDHGVDVLAQHARHDLRECL